jgi:hypothetical protein
VLAGALGTVFGAVAGLKLFLVGCHAVSGWAMYALARRWSGSRQVALLACIAYVLSYQRFHTLMTLGRLPEAAALRKSCVTSGSRYASARRLTRSKMTSSG